MNLQWEAGCRTNPNFNFAPRRGALRTGADDPILRELIQ
jgi:hypothetical protein